MVILNLTLLQEATRIFFAIVVGSILGLERMKFHKAAGVRTHAIITVVCTMITMVSAYGFVGIGAVTDPTRLISNILTGVGFLSGGVIYVTTKVNNKRAEEGVVGLTTAAGIFGAATLGIPIGLGYYPLVIITLLAILFSLKTEYILRKLHILKTNQPNKDESI